MNTLLTPTEKVARWLALHQVRVRYDSSIAHMPEYKAWQAWLPYNDAFPHLGANGAPQEPRMCGYGSDQLSACLNLAQVEGLRTWIEEAA
jgi:hypothetical protein